MELAQSRTRLEQDCGQARGAGREGPGLPHSRVNLQVGGYDEDTGEGEQDRIMRSGTLAMKSLAPLGTQVPAQAGLRRGGYHSRAG